MPPKQWAMCQGQPVWKAKGAHAHQRQWAWSVWAFSPLWGKAKRFPLHPLEMLCCGRLAEDAPGTRGRAGGTCMVRRSESWQVVAPCLGKNIPSGNPFYRFCSVLPVHTILQPPERPSDWPCGSPPPGEMKAPAQRMFLSSVQQGLYSVMP